MNALAHGIIEKPKDWREDQGHDLAKFYVETV
jgi:hypothetical protein